MVKRKKARKRNTCEGIIHDVCAHRISYWYNLEQHTLTDRMREFLEEATEEHVKQCIIDGYVSGQLYVYYQFDDDEKPASLEEGAEFLGWWNIEH